MDKKLQRLGEGDLNGHSGIRTRLDLRTVETRPATTPVEIRLTDDRRRPDLPARIAVLLPCRDEVGTIADVVAQFQSAIPNAEIFVYDNGSTDGTAAAAERAGAVVRSESRVGKGHVVRRMFSDIDADVYVLADGDGTYDAADAPAMISHLLDNQLDMVIGRRVETCGDGAYRPGHRLGDW